MTNTLPRPSDTSTATTADFTTALSQIRIRIGDTGGENGSGRVYLSDERIANIYAQFPSVLSASVECIRNILGEIARDVDRGAGQLNAQTSQVFANYRALLEMLERELRNEVTTRLGGVSTDRRDTLFDNADFPRPTFEIGQDRYTGA